MFGPNDEYDEGRPLEPWDEQAYAADDHDEPAAPPPITLDPLQRKAIDDCRDQLYTNISGTAGQRDRKSVV